MTSRPVVRIRSSRLAEGWWSARPWRALCRALLAAALLVVAACTSGPLLERAIRARGGPLTALVTRSEARVYVGVPGTWQVVRAWQSPDRYAWKILTAADPLYHLYDGAAARSFVGTAEVARDASPGAPLRTHARWTAVVNLDALRAPGVAISPLPARDLPPGVHAGLSATLPDGVRYRLGFDDRPVLVWAEGPLDLSPFGQVDMTARFTDHRRAGHLLLPFTTSYSVARTPLADETVLAACIDPPGLTPASFVDPARMPDCP